ncbi:MAG: hypothetical protein U0892_19590 [Pirellulales bacterium]
MHTTEQDKSDHSTDSIRLSDFFVATAVGAAFAGAPMFRTALPGFIALSLTFLFVWKRPLVFRFWSCGMIGFGTGMYLAGTHDLQGYYMQNAELVGWGGGIVLGTITAIVLFIGPLAMKPDQNDRRH